MGPTPREPMPPLPDAERLRQYGLHERRRWWSLAIALFILIAAGASIWQGCSALDAKLSGKRESSSKLIARFNEHRAEFKELLRLARKAGDLEDAIYAAQEAGNEELADKISNGEKIPGLKRHERLRYLELRRKLGVKSIIVNDNDVEFVMVEGGLAIATWRQSYVWSRVPPVHDRDISDPVAIGDSWYFWDYAW